jgi:LPXTG-motif cell wall-anchored protein
VDFFETWFGLSPDGGDGSTEMLWLGAIIVAVIAIVFRRRIMAALTSRSSKRR